MGISQQTKGIKQMSDQFYAVQFRSMHTAIHSVVIFSLEHVALELFDLLERNEMFPETFGDEFQDPKFFVDMYEIDYRDIPRECQGVEILYVNNKLVNGDNAAPDVYNY